MRSVLITGGAQGIGRGITRRLHTDGWAVAVLERDAAALSELTEVLGGADRLLGLEGDAGNEADITTAVAQTVARFGGLHGAVANACWPGCATGPVERLDLDTWQAVLRTNLTGPFLLAKHAAPHLRDAHGALVNIASTRAFQSEAHTEAYAASKGGLVALTHALAVSLGPAVRVNAIAPGWIETGDHQRQGRQRPVQHSEADRAQHPCGRVGVPADIAELAAFLLDSAKSGFITGQCLVCDGGMTVKMIYV